MTEATFNTGEIRDKAVAVEAAARLIEEQLGQLRLKIMELRGYWQGPASQALEGMYDSFNKEAAVMDGVLDWIGRAMKVAADNYDRNEEAIAKMFMESAPR